MVAVQSPLIDLQYDDRTGRYIANLERRITALVINETKFRALLELITGEEWDNMETDFEASSLRKLAEESLVAKGMRPTEAHKLVYERWNGSNQPKANPVPQAQSVD